jgi:hypothetical protein
MRISSAAVIVVILAASVFAQQQQRQQPPQTPLRSPEILPDNRVTFRLLAPQATNVSVTGDWPGGIHSTTTPMVKDDAGIFSVTVGPLKPEFWVYNFNVDGATVVDPANVHIRRNGARYSSALLIPGPESASFSVNDIPHGTVHMAWYPSPTLQLTRRVYVYTPPGYEINQERYPVFYLLHGGGGDEDAWNTCGRVTQIMDSLIAQGKAKPMIVVMPNGNGNQVASQVCHPLAIPAGARSIRVKSPVKDREE